MRILTIYSFCTQPRLKRVDNRLVDDARHEGTVECPISARSSTFFGVRTMGIWPRNRLVVLKPPTIVLLADNTMHFEGATIQGSKLYRQQKMVHHTVPINRPV